jgi:hypothetical protein
MQKRNIEASYACVFCNQHKTVQHALLSYQLANEGVKSEHDVHLRRGSFISPRTWVLDFLDRNSIQISTAATVWRIWDARNKAREGEGLVHPSSLAARINAYVDSILLHLYTPTTIHRRELSSSVKGAPPPEGTILVNVGVSMFKSTRQMGTGIVARHHNGSFLAAYNERYDNVLLPDLAEALAIRRALSFAFDEGFPKIIIASDCLSVIQHNV